MIKNFNERNLYLLKFFGERHPLGFSKHHRLPLILESGELMPDGYIGMSTFRGLERRGLVREGNHGLLYITELGLKTLGELKDDTGENNFRNGGNAR